jgi:small subunit ribosomal protein S2
LNDKNAVLEAKKLNIPIVAVVDSNADPSTVDYPIPANDDAIKAIQLITDYIVEAISTGKAKTKKSEQKTADSEQ